MSTRRDFLKASGLVVMAGSAGFLGTDQFIYGQDESTGPVKSAGDERQKPTLVTIFLRGGADALNAVVPYGDDLYYKYRSRIGLRPEATGKMGVRGVVKLEKSNVFGLNGKMES